MVEDLDKPEFDVTTINLTDQDRLRGYIIFDGKYLRLRPGQRTYVYAKIKTIKRVRGVEND